MNKINKANTVFELKKKPVYVILAYYFHFISILDDIEMIFVTKNKIIELIDDVFPKKDSLVGIDEDGNIKIDKVNFNCLINFNKSKQDKIIFSCNAVFYHSNNDVAMYSESKIDLTSIKFKLILEPSLRCKFNVKVIGKFGKKYQFLKYNIEDLFNSVFIKQEFINIGE